MSSEVYSPRPGSFSHVIGLFMPAFALCWRQIRTIFAISILYIVAVLGWDFFSAAIAPDYTVAQALAVYGGEFGVQEDDAALPDDWYDAPDGAYVDDEQEQGQQEASPIYMVLNVMGMFVLFIAQFVAAYFVVGTAVREQRRVGLRETLLAIRACPRRFYTALLKKWLFAMILPAVGLVAVIAVLSAISDSLAAVVGVAGVLAVFVWMAYLMMKWIFVEAIVLFEGMRFGEAAAKSARLIKGSKRSFFFAYMLLAIAMSMAAGIALMLYFGVMMMGVFALALISELLILPAVLAAMVPMAVLYTFPLFFYVAIIFMVYDALAKKDDATPGTVSDRL